MTEEADTRQTLRDRTRNKSIAVSVKGAFPILTVVGLILPSFFSAYRSENAFAFKAELLSSGGTVVVAGTNSEQ
jgi:hypothetical protein